MAKIDEHLIELNEKADEVEKVLKRMTCYIIRGGADIEVAAFDEDGLLNLVGGSELSRDEAKALGLWLRDMTEDPGDTDPFSVVTKAKTIDEMGVHSYAQAAYWHKTEQIDTLSEDVGTLEKELLDYCLKMGHVMLRYNPSGEILFPRKAVETYALLKAVEESLDEEGKKEAT